MGRKTGPYLGGVFLPINAVIAEPVPSDITEEEFVARIEAEMQESCDECGVPVIDCECGAQWLGEPEN